MPWIVHRVGRGNELGLEAGLRGEGERIRDRVRAVHQVRGGEARDRERGVVAGNDAQPRDRHVAAGEDQEVIDADGEDAGDLALRNAIRAHLNRLESGAAQDDVARRTDAEPGWHAVRRLVGQGRVATRPEAGIQRAGRRQATQDAPGPAGNRLPAIRMRPSPRTTSSVIESSVGLGPVAVSKVK